MLRSGSRLPTQLPKNLPPVAYDVGSVFDVFSFRRLKNSYLGPAGIGTRTDGKSLILNFTNRNIIDIVQLLDFAAGGDVFLTALYGHAGRGRIYTPPTSAARPKLVSSGVLQGINGLPGISFNGTSNYLLGNAQANNFTNNATGLTIISAFKTGADITTNTCMFSASVNANSFTVRTYFGAQTTNKYRSINRSTDAGGQQVSGSPSNNVYVNGTPFVGSMAVDFPNNVVKVYKDGTENYSTSGTMAISNNTDATDSNATAIGAFTNGTAFYNGIMADIILLNSAVNTTIRAAHESNIRTYYGF